MPTLALAGTGKTQLSANSPQQVAQNLSKVSIPNAGHYIQEEHPAELAFTLKRFLH